MKNIPQRELRNFSGEVLRLAEAGEFFLITVNDRPVAVLGHYERRQWVPMNAVREILRHPTDPAVLDGLKRVPESDHRDPWQR